MQKTQEDFWPGAWAEAYDGRFIPREQMNGVYFEIKHLEIITVKVLKHLALSLSVLYI